MRLMQTFPFTHLSILCLDPILVKVMMPKVAFVTIGRVVPPAVDTTRGVQARHTFSHGGNRGGRLSIPFPTSRESVVVLSSMWSHTQGVLQLKCMTSQGGVTPLPTALAECNTRVSLARMNIGNLPTHLDGMVDYLFRPCPTDSVSNVYGVCASYVHDLIILILSAPACIANPISEPTHTTPLKFQASLVVSR